MNTEDKTIEVIEEVSETKTENKEKQKRKMTLPNKLTLIRIVLIPVLFIVYYIPYLRENYIFLKVSYAFFIDFFIFVVASVTDFFDGFIRISVSEHWNFSRNLFKIGYGRNY